ncbi:SDR family oxidoreductase [Maribacter sp. 2210JD10-5]|uniref:SDR family oxidoreductase n=1 Tax=Maribacter sp. 2210JD10-5 TaxID=3386272 RepID=UPI0039BD5BCF
MIKSVAIMGCGWLGFPLAKRLLQEGYTIKGSTTSENKLETLQKEGIAPYLIQLTEHKIIGDISGFLQNQQLLIINVPPRLRGKGSKESFVEKMKLVAEAVKKSSIKKVIFVSSTSVYGDISGDVTEETTPVPQTESGKQLLQSELLFKKSLTSNITIIRFGGLIGPDRHPVTMLSGRENLSGGNAPVNLIHLDDCIRIISAILKKDQWGETFNAVYPHHPKKQEYYTLEAKKRTIKAPEYQKIDNKKYKKVTTCKYFLLNSYTFQTSIVS